MQSTLAISALVMGLAGGPHCIAMCGAACAGIGRSGVKSAHTIWIFQVGRLAGYSAMGGLAALSMQSLGWLTVHAVPLRPLWSLVHVAAAMLGLMLLWQARQPVWLENGARKVWSHVRNVTGNVQGVAPLLIGMMWSLLPCGLLYSALLVAALAGSVIDGVAVMALFALGSGVSLMLGPWLLLRLGRQGSGRWSIRVAGLMLFATSVWGLWMSLMHNTAPWCVTG